MSTLVEICAGTASLSLWAMARVEPLTGFMGSKRRDRATLMRVLDVDRPDRVHLVDAGPWGEVWAVMAHSGAARRRVARVLRGWGAQGALVDVWPLLVQCAPPSDPAVRVAQYIAIQARVSSCVPVWWGGAEWLSGDTRGAQQKRPNNKPGSGGVNRIETLAERVEALDAIDWSRVTVHQCDVGDAPAVPHAREYFDPPYKGAPRYAVLLSRDRVLDVARRRRLTAERVVVSEAEPLPLDAWATARLRPAGDKPEWLTMTARDPADLRVMVATAELSVAAQALRRPRNQMTMALESTP